MKYRSTTAHEFILSLQARVIDRDEIIKWADGIIETEGYDDAVAEISLATNITDKELESRLSIIAADGSEWDGARRMLGRMHGTLVAEPDRLHSFTLFLECLCIRNDYDIPSDLRFIIGLEDDFQLAESGQWSSMEDVRNELIKCLAPYVIERPSGKS